MKKKVYLNSECKYRSEIMIMVIRIGLLLLTVLCTVGITSAFTVGSTRMDDPCWRRRRRCEACCGCIRHLGMFHQISSLATRKQSLLWAHHIRRQRSAVAGVSVSEEGFYIILRTGIDAYWPIQVTQDPMDQCSATSPEALTILQLLTGVDMAGAILPPDLLSKIVIMQAEYDLFNTTDTDGGMGIRSDATSYSISPREFCQEMVKYVQRQLRSTSPSSSNYLYSQQLAWSQSRISLPVCTVDEIRITPPASSSIAGTTAITTSSASTTTTTTTTKPPIQYHWQCSVRGLETTVFSLQPLQSILSQVLYQYHPETSLAFVSVALALRYRAPIVLLLEEEQTAANYADDSAATGAADNNDDNAASSGTNKQDEEASTIYPECFVPLRILQKRFPLYRTIDGVQQTSNRAVSAVKDSYEIHQLQAALRIAMQKGDIRAVQKIRSVLDQKDSLQDLPVQPDTDLSDMQ